MPQGLTVPLDQLEVAEPKPAAGTITVPLDALSSESAPPHVQSLAELEGQSPVVPVARPAPMDAHGVTQPESVRVTPAPVAAPAAPPQPAVAPRGYFNPKTGTYAQPAPGTGLLGWDPLTGLRTAGQGIVALGRQLARPPVQSGEPHVLAPSPAAARAAWQVLEGSLEVAKPLAIPALLSNPISTTVAVAGSSAVHAAVFKAMTAIGADPDRARLAADIAQTIVVAPVAKWTHETLATAAEDAGAVGAELVADPTLGVSIKVGPLEIPLRRPVAPGEEVAPKPAGAGSTDAAIAAKAQLPATAPAQPPSPETAPPVTPVPAPHRAPLDRVVADLAQANASGDIAARKTALQELQHRGIDEEEAVARAQALTPTVSVPSGALLSSEPAAGVVNEPHTFSSTQVPLPPAIAQGLQALGAKIPDEDLAEDGREADPHITVKYGLHTSDPDEVRQVLADEPPVQVTMGKTSIFPASEAGKADVVKVDVDSPDLHRLNQKLSDALETTDTHPDYKPHATVAYVKPGLGEQYAGDASLDGHQATIDRVSFTAKDGTRVDVPLTGVQNAPREPTEADVEAGPRRGDRGVEQPAPDAGGTPEAAGEGASAERRRLPPPALDEPFHRQSAADTLPRLTPEVTRELSRMLDELQTYPYQGRTWNWLESGPKTGNAAGGAADIVAGHAGAEVRKDILGYAPVNKVTSGKRKGEFAKEAQGTGQQVSQAIESLLTNKAVHNNLAEGALRVAERRAIGDYSIISHPMLPPSWGEVATPEFLDAVDQGIDEHVDADTGDISFNPDEFEPKTDVLETGEQQPRLPEAGAVRDVEHQTPAFEAPFSLTGEAAAPKGREQDLFAGESHKPSFARTEEGRIRAGIGDEGAAARIMASSLYSKNIADVATKELLQNALDAVRPRGDNGIVTVNLQRGESGKLPFVEVEDSGPGMTRREIETVFTNLFESGKRESTTAAGGFGIAKASFLLGGKEVRVETVVDTPQGKQQLSFAATPEELTSPTGIHVQEQAVPRGTPTGTRIRTTLPAAAQMYDARRFAEAVAEHSSALPGTLQVYVDGGKVPVAESTPQRRARFAGYESLDLTIPGAKVRLSLSPDTEEKNSGTVRVLNHGIYQFDEYISTANTANGEYQGPSISMPRTIIADIQATVPEGDPRYPFTANREQLRGDFNSTLKRAIYEDMMGPRRQAATSLLERTYRTLPSIPLDSGERIPILDVGKRMRSQEVEQLFAEPAVRRAITTMVNVVREALARGLAEQAGGVERVGVLLDSATHGVFVPNPATGGPERKATILINPFSHLVDDPAPDAVAAALYHTIVHEAAHWSAPGHNEHFTVTLADKFRRLGARFEISALSRLMEAYGDPAHPADLDPAVARAFSVYQESRRRPVVEEDALSRTGHHATRSSDEPIGEAGVARSVADRGKPTIAERAASERGEIAVPASVTRGVQEAARSAVAPLREVRNVIAPQSASPEAQRTADVVAQAKAKAANLATVEAIKYRPITKQFDRRTDAQNLAAIAAYERTGTFPDAPEGYSEFYRQSMATARTLLQNAYGDDAVGYVENYVRRAFVFGSKADEKTGTTVLTNAVRTLAANRSPTKGRVLDMPIDEALALLKGRGLSVKLETTNPERLRQWSLANARQASAFRQAWETLKDSAFVSFVPLGQRRPEGYDPISERGAQFFYPKERGLGDYYAEPNVARVLNNATSKGLGGSPTFRALRLMNGSLNQIQLGLSAFHLTGTIINAGMADVSLGLRQVFRGEAKGAARVATGLVPGASFVRDVVLGHQFLEDLKNDAPAAFDALQSRLNPGGARLQMDQRYDTQMRQQLIRAWREGRPIGAAVRLPLAAVEAIASPLMNFAIPRVKIAVALERSADVQQRMPNASPEQLARAYRATMDQIDNVFGLLVYDNGFWNKTAQDLSQLATRSVGWTGGTLRWGVGAMADVGQLLRGGGGGRKPPPGAAGAPAGAEPPPFDGRVPGVSDRLLDALILPIYVGLIGAVYMYLHTKKRPQSAKDYYYPLNGRLDSNGHPSRTSLPTYMKDVYAYGTDPFGTLLRKQSPLFDEGTALWGNEDYWHVMIRDPRDPMARQLADVGRYLARENLPFSLQQATVPTVGGVSAEQKAEAVLGFTKASVRVTETPAEAYLHRIAPPSHLTHDEAARATARRDVRGLLQAGQPAEAMAAARAAGLSPASVRDTVRSAREGGLVSAFKRTTWNDAVHTYELATPEERQKLRTPFLQKVGRALAGAPATERAAILAQRTAALQLPTQ